MTWHSRGYLPHWEAGETPQAITFRLADSLPQSLLVRWREELAHLDNCARTLERRLRIERALDQGRGASLLRRPELAQIVEDAFLFGDASRYHLLAWVIMPNHVHVLVTPSGEWTLSSILEGWKSVTARRINAMIGGTGKVWAREYFDRKIRNPEHYDNVMNYMAANPVKARLCNAPQEWRFSSSWQDAQDRSLGPRASPRALPAALK